MTSIFAPDSALMRFLTRIADLMILNVLFIATSLPVVTLGASLTALNFVAMRIATDTDESITGDYWRSFRENFRQATLIGLIVAAVAGVFAAWFVVVANLAVAAVVEIVLMAVWYVLVFAFAMTVLYVFPYLAKFEGSTREVLRNARLMSWRHPLAPVTVVVLLALSAVVTAFSPQVTGYGLLWFLIGFAGIAVLSGGLYARVFGKYVTPARTPSTTVGK